MPFEATAEQKAIIEAQLVSQRVVACAGSGKTATAVRRLLEIRERLGAARGYVALLSYSNVAVETFRNEYSILAREMQVPSDRVLISTVDSFITSNILSPHASRSMGCERQPFLVRGSEPFLKSFKVFNGDHGVDIEHLRVSLGMTGDLVYSESSYHSQRSAVASEAALKAIYSLAKIGAYTYELGRFWALQTLTQQQRLINILACRYPFVLVDEAQDVGPMHGALLSLLQDAGCTVSLIGDPNQSIYEFADADGTFLKDFKLAAGGISQSLTENRRSVQAIVTFANQLSGTASKSIREAPVRKHGVYLIRYKKDELDNLFDTFATILKENEFEKSEAAILCRGNSLVERLTGGANEIGQGATEKFACAATCRDRRGDIADTFELALDGVLKLLKKVPSTLRSDILASSNEPVQKKMRHLVWQFLRNSDIGLPSATLNAKTVWLPQLKKRLPTLLTAIEEECGFIRLDTWNYNVTAAKLGDGPLWNELLTENSAGISVRTVHRSKGESIGAVLYITKTADINSLLDGPVNEEGRIGYVAVTRACDLLILAVPSSAPKVAIARLQANGVAIWE
jgi:superfamily I DNA/RNA helicase